MAKIKAELKKEIADMARNILETPIIDLSEPSNQQKGTLFKFGVQKLLRDPSASIRLATLELLLAYGFGKPVQQIEAKTENTQKFVAEVPPLQNNEDWMARYGNPGVAEALEETEN
jgi:hypothetical protein